MSVPAESAMRQPNDASGRPVRILVVDDYPIVRRGLIDLFNEAPGLTVTGEADAIAPALALLAKRPCDVAVIDLSLGAESGLDLVGLVAARHPGVRVLMLSGHDEQVHAERALKAGALGYVMKDRAAGELIAAVRRVASGRPYVSAAAADRILSALGGRRRPAASPLERLSDREWHVCTLLAQGLATREIAATLGLSVKTIESHYAHLKAKLGARNSHDLMRLAVVLSAEEPRAPAPTAPAPPSPRGFP